MFRSSTGPTLSRQIRWSVPSPCLIPESVLSTRTVISASKTSVCLSSPTPHDGEEYCWPYGIDTRLTLDGNGLRTAIGLANRRLVRESEGHDDYAGMGTTVVSALIAGSRLVVGHVGDSRLSMLTDGVLTPVDNVAALVVRYEGEA